MPLKKNKIDLLRKPQSIILKKQNYNLCSKKTFEEEKISNFMVPSQKKNEKEIKNSNQPLPNCKRYIKDYEEMKLLINEKLIKDEINVDDQFCENYSTIKVFIHLLC